MTNPRLEELRAKFQENPRRYFAPYANELRKAGDPSQAISVCRTHLATQPGHVSGHIVLGQALYEAGQTDEARDVFSAALGLDPENLIALRSLGEIAQVNGDFDAARQWYQRLLDADPRNSEVAQLLRDIPAEAPAKPILAPPPEVADDPTPFTIREEIAAAEAPPAPIPAPAPAAASSKIHTGFTGPGPAYKTAEDEREEALSKQAAEAPLSESEDAFIDLQPSAHDQGVQTPEKSSEPVNASTESEPVEMVDIVEETEAFAAEAAQQAMPDESFDSVEPSTSRTAPEESFQPISGYESEEPYVQEPSSATEMSSEQEPDFETDETYTTQAASDASPSLEIQDFAADALTPETSRELPPAEETPEHPRAMFAERGFDGSVDDMGWMTTPSQAFSDLEAAPENWLEESDEESYAAAEASSAEPEAEGSTPEDPATDSWFDEVPGATSIDATEVTSDELWLPPELPPATKAEADALSPDEFEMSAETPQEAQARSASADEEYASSAPDAMEPDTAHPAEAMASAEEEEADISESSSYTRAESTDMPDEVAEPVAAQSAHDVYADFESIDVDASSGEEEIHHGDVASGPEETEPTAQSEPSEYEEDLVDPVSPEFYYAETNEQVAASSSDVIGQTPSDVVSPPMPAPFYTETLAELYVQQGFRDEALAIYRQLVDRNPSDEGLRSRLAALEQREVPLSSPVPPDTRAASQSVRTFFSRLARRAAVMPPLADSPGGGDAGASGTQTEVPFSVAASALANLFSASKPPQADEGAASTLAAAFTDPAGRPSRAAERELSLDHLFRDVAPGGPATGGVTLDEFYSTPNSGTGSSTEPGSEAGPDESTDIRQFTAWLEGLRKK